jgi:hypothetical protein
MNRSGQGPILGYATLDDGGHLVAGPVFHGAHETRRQLTPAELAPFEAAILELPPDPPPQPSAPRPACCDLGYESVVVMVGGRAYPQGRADRLYALIWSLQRTAQREAEEQYWQRAAPFDPGKAWTVTLKDCGENRRPEDGVSPGRWPRMDTPNTYDATFHAPGSKEGVHDAVVVESVVHERIVLRRERTHQVFFGLWNPDSPDEFSFWGGYLPPMEWRQTAETCSFTVKISR